jgi:hypothetical protein
MDRTPSADRLGSNGTTSMFIAALLLMPGVTCLADTQFDGYYVGTRVVIHDGARTCPHNGNVAWQIVNGQFAYKFWAGRVPVQVSADGSLRGETLYRPSQGAHSWVKVNGTISNGSLEADAEWRACQLHFSLRKV